MIQIEYLPIVLTGIGIIASVLYYTSVLRNANRTQQMQLETRQAQVYMTLFNTINNQDIWKNLNEIRQYSFTDFDDFMEKFGPEKNPEAYAKITKVLWLFTEMGTLVYRGHITTEDVRHLMATNPVDTWRKFGPIIEGFRANVWNSRGGYRTFEYLAKTMMAEIESGINDQFLDNVINATPDIEIK